MSDRDIIDEIDALVDAQLGQEPSGYDHNINQDRCPHCGEDWHGLAITERMRQMRREYQRRSLWSLGERDYAESTIDPDYRYSEDESRVICPGSEFIGPWATKAQLERMRSWRDRGERGFTVGWTLPEFADSFDSSQWVRTPVPSPLDVQFRQLSEINEALSRILSAPNPVAGYAEGGLIRGPNRERRQIDDGPPLFAGRDFTIGDRIPARDPEREIESYGRSPRTRLGRPWMTGGRIPREGERVAFEMVDGRRVEGVVRYSDPFTTQNGHPAVSLTIEPDQPESEHRISLRRWLPGDPVPAADEPSDPVLATLRRAIRRPDTTPPMWANNPSRQNRRRNR